LQKALVGDLGSDNLQVAARIPAVVGFAGKDGIKHRGGKKKGAGLRGTDGFGGQLRRAKRRMRSAVSAGRSTWGEWPAPAIVSFSMRGVAA
jgi:hypothetical protein